MGCGENNESRWHNHRRNIETKKSIKNKVTNKVTNKSTSRFYRGCVWAVETGQHTNLNLCPQILTSFLNIERGPQRSIFRSRPYLRQRSRQRTCVKWGG
jgi:hypothetical protein